MNLFEWQLHEVEEHFVEIPHKKMLKRDDSKFKKKMKRSVLNCKKSLIGDKIHVVPFEYGHQVCQI